MVGVDLGEVPWEIFQVGCGPSVSACDELVIDFPVLLGWGIMGAKAWDPDGCVFLTGPTTYS